MSIVRELKASFIARANGLKSTIQGVKREISDLEKKTKTFSNNTHKSFAKNTRNFANHVQKFSVGAQKHFNNAGNTLIDYSNRLQKASEKTKSYGKNLTKKITLPVVGAMTAVGGLTAALGWKRLVGLDTAKAQLKGLGYEAKDVERITEQVTRAIDGGMTTMAEGTAIAAGGLAAGVKEGKELERYIKLVGDAAVGANRPVDEMAQIFNRVQGGGRLMTMELNMIEQGLPGFAQAMADELAGGSLESFRDMVTNSEVGSKEFLNVMDDFAGGMAEAYSESWAGMTKNTLAYVGIIGESMLEGVFKEGKKSLAEFIELLKSEKVQAWAKRVGRFLKEVFTEIVDKVKSGVEWFQNLSNSQQKSIIKFGAIAVAIGPVILLLGSLGNSISGITKGFGFLSLGLGKLSGVVGKVAGAFGRGGLQGVISAVGAKFPWLTRLITLLTGPIGMVISVLSLLGLSFYGAYKKFEPLRNALGKMGGLLKDIYTSIKNALPWMNIFSVSTDGLKSSFGGLLNGLKIFGDFLLKSFGAVITITVQGLNMLLGAIKVVIDNLGTFVSAIKKLFTGDFKGAFDDLLKGVSDVFFGLLDLLKDFIVPIKDKALEIGKVIVTSITGWVSGLYGKTRDYFVEFVTNFGTHIVALKDIAVEKLTSVTKAFVGWAKDLPGKVKDGLVNLKDAFVERLGDILESVGDFSRKYAKIITDGLNRLPGEIKKGLLKAAEVFKDWIENQHEQNKEFYGNLGENIKDWISSKKKSITEGFKTWKDATISFFKDLPDDIKEHTTDWWDAFSQNFLDRKDAIVKRLGEWKDAVLDFFKTMPKEIGKRVKDWWTEFKQGFLDKKKDIIDGFNEWKDGILGWFKSMPKTIREQAGTFSTSFKDGIIEKKNDIVDGFNAWWEGIKAWFSGLGNKEEIKETGKTIVKNVSEGAEEQKDDLMSRIGSIILDIPKYILIVAGILFLAVGRELIKRLSKGMDETKSSVTNIVSKLWENVKRIFSEKTNEIFNNLKDTFIGRIILSVINFTKRFVKGISDMWTSTEKTFTRWINDIFQGLKNSFVGRIISNIISFSKDFRGNLSQMWTLVKKLFSKEINEIRNSIANSFVGRMLSSIGTLKTNFIRIAKEMWQGVKKQFNNIVDGAKALPGKMGQGISGAKNKAINAMKGVGNNLITWAGTPFNKVIGGVNWVTGKLGIKKKIPYWNYPQYAKGTSKGGHPGGMAMIGEEGRELVQLPDGQSFVSPGSHTLLDLPEGSHVVPNKQTEKILDSDLPHYAKGTSGWQSVIGDVWDYIKNPGKIVAKIWDNIATKTGMAEAPRNIINGGMSYLKDKAMSFIKGGYKEAEKLGGGKPAFGWPITSPFGYRTHPISGGRKLHGGTDFGAPAGTPIPSTTGGTVSYAGGGWNGGFGNLVKVRQGIMEYFYAHMSKIIAKAGQSVNKGTILGLVGSTGASTGPHLHYEARRNGVRVDPMKLKGFADGGIVDYPTLAWIAEGGWAESIISQDPSKRVRQRAIWQDTGDRLGFTDDGNNKEILAQLERIAKAVEESHGHDIVMNDRLVAEMVEPHITGKQNLRKNRRRRSP